MIDLIVPFCQFKKTLSYIVYPGHDGWVISSTYTYALVFIIITNKP